MLIKKYFRNHIIFIKEKNKKIYNDFIIEGGNKNEEKFNLIINFDVYFMFMR